MAKITIPVGPQHPALEEPESFNLILDGERIIQAGVRLGYNHRGIEKACEERTYTQDMYLIERICGICSHSHSTCFVQAVEEIAGIEIPERASYIRTLIGELERMHSHLLWLGVAGHEIGFDTLFMYTWRDREIVMDVLELITGNRVNYGMNTIGGVRRDITKEEVSQVLDAMDKLEERTKYYLRVAYEEVTMMERLRGVGRLPLEDALRLGTTGPTARASGVDRDVRRDDPYAAYKNISINVITDDHCDVLGRVIVRVKELMESYNIIRSLLSNMPEGAIKARAPVRIPAGEACSRYEAPRGEDVHYVKSNGTDHPERVKVRAPTLANLAAMSQMLEGGYLADVPITIAAIDPCFSCADRCISVTDLNSGNKGVMDRNSLRRYSIDWYRERDIDFSRISGLGGK
jgi:NADH-quinone oxidoreductase subunit D